jgi:deazaflavin-dependent oxidoreductase (nitroreductase family)
MQAKGQNTPQQQSDSRSQLNKRSNAIFLKIAGGRLRAYSLLKHVGRSSGKEYSTPLTAYPLGDGFVIALLYGDATTVSWCRNVMAAGKCILKTRGQEYVLGRPEIISASQALPAYPSLFRFVYKSRGIQQFLWVHRMPI